MTNQKVPADIVINETVVSEVLLDQFGLHIENIKLLGEGFDNAVYLINHNLVFRFPRRAEAISLIEHEMNILPRIKSHIQLEIPCPEFFGTPSQQFPRPFYGHRIIDGISGCKVNFSRAEYEQTAIDIARFLRGLHSLNLADLNLKKEEISPAFDRSDFPRLEEFFNKRVNDISYHYGLSSYQANFRKICDDARSYVPKRVSFIHGDMYHRHLIFRDNKLHGIIDWGDSSWGDPVTDLGIVYQFLPCYTHPHFFAEYGPVDDNAKNYARFIGVYLAIALLWFGHDRNDHDLIRTSLATITGI